MLELIVGFLAGVGATLLVQVLFALGIYVEGRKGGTECRSKGGSKVHKAKGS